jgi:hypothetical protein
MLLTIIYVFILSTVTTSLEVDKWKTMRAFTLTGGTNC